MTKSQEIEAFRAFWHALPDASYIRPWFSEIQWEVESIIGSDHHINLSPRKSQQLAEACIKNAQAEAASIVQRAEIEANTIRFAAHRDAAAVRDNARIALRRIADSI
jgi:hypothetical protein